MKAFRDMSLDELLSVCQRANSCVVWPFNKTKKGYGMVRLDNTDCSTSMGYVHRLVFAKAFGNFDESMMVCHKCDNPSCINPEHLVLGTAADNLRDMAEKSRGRKSSLHASDVDKMRSLYAEGWTQQAIGRIFNVSQSTVSMVVNRKMKSYG